MAAGRAGELPDFLRLVQMFPTRILASVESDMGCPGAKALRIFVFCLILLLLRKTQANGSLHMLSPAWRSLVAQGPELMGKTADAQAAICDLINTCVSDRTACLMRCCAVLLRRMIKEDFETRWIVKRPGRQEKDELSPLMGLNSRGVVSGKAQHRTQLLEETQEPCATAFPVWHPFGEQGSKCANCVQMSTSGSRPLDRPQAGSKRGAGQQREEESTFPCQHVALHRYGEKF